MTKLDTLIDEACGKEKGLTLEEREIAESNLQAELLQTRCSDNERPSGR